eukprot:gb/GEZN01004989.1/.p1 GENE.gb/GEZN01004989.1/~~gb/GEZN01004989.1/.p1  ORF type:complete len:367 (-),score=53.54 gb/GEZN01004989.1/:659-1759(-)
MTDASGAARTAASASGGGGGGGGGGANNTPTITTPATLTTKKKTTKKKNGKDEVARCYGCRCAESPLHNGLTCDQGHYLHGEGCLRNFLGVALAQESWKTHIPIQCAICRTDYHPHLLEAVMTKEELEVYHTAILVVGVAVNEQEVLVNCPFCKYAAVADKKEVPLLFFCEAPECKKRSCTICRKVVTQEEADMHLIDCAQHGQVYQEVQELVENGNTVPCPSCGLRGQKDGNCTHMTCPRCKTRWCYCCGYDEHKGSTTTAGGAVWPLAHNEEWKTNRSRCPLYLQEFHEIDQSFSDDVILAVVTFHQQRTLRLLQRKLQEVGLVKFRAMLGKFPNAMSGYTLEQIQRYKPMSWCAGRRLGDAPP